MKNIKIKILVPIVYLGILLLHAGCSKMNDMQKEFVGDGEILYIAKPDSLYTNSGINKIELNWTITSDPKIAGYKIYWNNRNDSLIKEINRGTGVEHIKILLPNLPEGTYSFDIYSYDNAGNMSIKSTILGKVYGDIYKSSLLPHSFRKLSRTGNELVVDWMSPETEFAGAEINYLDKSGKTVTLKIDKSAETSRLPEFPLGSSFELISAFKPAANAIDTFFVTNTIRVPMKEVDWKPYTSVFGHLGSLLALNSSGTLVCYVGDGNGGFRNEQPVLIDYPWYIFDNVWSYKGNLIGREMETGWLYRYNVTAKGEQIPPHARLGPAGWYDFDILFTNDDFLFGRRPSGELMRYPLLDGGVMGAGLAINGTYSQYNKIVASGDNIMARKPDGTLWRIPVSPGGVAGTAVKIAEGWNEYVMISRLGLDLLAKTGTGELWRFPVDANGNLGAGAKIVVSYENLQ